MVDEPYKILGVSKSANEADIRKAYRKIAKKYHPDVRPNDKAAEDKFKQASAAFALLNNKEERARYDRGEIDASGNPTGAFAGARANGQRGGFPGGFAPGGHDDISDILSELFGRQAGMGRRKPFAMRGEDQHFRLTIDLVEAIKGGIRQVKIAAGKEIKIKIPAGVQSVKSLRLKGQGASGSGGGPAGDALVEILIKPHPFYVVDGNNIRIDLPITLKEAVLGAKVKIPTPDGAVSLSLPANTSSGKTFRIKGKGGVGSRGVRGDLLAKAMIILPDAGSKEWRNMLKSVKALPDFDPRSIFFS